MRLETERSRGREQARGDVKLWTWVALGLPGSGWVWIGLPGSGPGWVWMAEDLHGSSDSSYLVTPMRSREACSGYESRDT